VSDAKERIRAFLLERFLPGEPASALPDEAPLLDSGLLTSVTVLQLVAFLEKEFEIRVEARDLRPDNFGTVAKVAEFAARKRGGA
jgi:methoxymalonate biosynthesis acyl carrier protein